MTALEFRPVENDEISGREKQDMVGRIVKELHEDVQTGHLSNQARDNAIEQLKVSARDFRDASPLYTPEGIGSLIFYAFHFPSSSTTSHAALQGLANALLSGGAYPRKLFVDSGYSKRAVARLKHPRRDEEFLITRILFLTAYGTSQDFAYLVDSHFLAEHINENLARHAKAFGKLGKKSPTYEQDLTLSETLRLLFVVTHFCKHHIDAFQKSVGSIVKILSLKCIAPDMTRLMSNLVGSLSNLDLSCKKIFPSKTELRIAVEKMIQVLDQALKQNTSPQALENAIIPTLTVLQRIIQNDPAEVKTLMKKLLLPSKGQEIHRVAGTNYVMFNQDLISYRLIQLLRNPTSEKLKTQVEELLREVAGLDGRVFDRLYIGNESHSCKASPRTSRLDHQGFENNLFRINTSRALDKLATRSQPSLRNTVPPTVPSSPRKGIRPPMTRTKSDTALEAMTATKRLRDLLQSKPSPEQPGSATGSLAATVATALSLLEQTKMDSDKDEMSETLCGSGSEMSVRAVRWNAT